MQTNFNYKELKFPLSNSMLIPTTKTPEMKFMIKDKFIRSKSDKINKKPVFFESYNLILTNTPLKNEKKLPIIAPLNTKTYLPFNRTLEIKLKKDEMAPLKSPSDIQIPQLNNKNNINALEWAKINNIYSDCIEDLDVNCNYMKKKIEKKIIRNLQNPKKEIAETKNEDSNHKNRIIKKTTKNPKNKTIQKIKKEIIYKENDKTEIVLNKNNFELLFLRNSIEEKKKENFSKIFIFHCGVYSNNVEFNNFLLKIHEKIFKILIYSQKIEGIDLKNQTFDAVFKENCYDPLINFDYESLLSKLPLKTNLIEKVYLISLLKSDYKEFTLENRGEKILTTKKFLGNFPFILKKKEISIDLLYYFNEEMNNLKIFSDFILKDIKNNDKLVELDVKKIVNNVELASLTENFRESHINFIKNLKNISKCDENKDIDIWKEFLSFKKNVGKLVNKKKRKVVFKTNNEIYKTISNDLVKRNCNFFGKVICDPLKKFKNQEAIFENFNKLRQNFQKQIIKPIKLPKSTKIKVYCILDE